MMNKQQLEAINCLEGPLLVLAGAGTGKTTVIVHRIENLVQHGVSPKSILAVTFTNKAAREMQERISAAIGERAAKEMTIGTFHAFCLKELHKNIQHLGYSKNFSIASESYRKGLLAEIINQEGQARRNADAGYWLYCISMAKASARMPDDIREAGDEHSRDLADVYESYQNRMRQMDLLDFDDLLCLTVQLWKEQPAILEASRSRYTHIMVDEFQDTNDVQMQLVLNLASGHGNIAVVGDDDQSIYGWRGANVQNILAFEKTFPGAKIMRLEQNYRSTNTILRAANRVIARNPQRLGKVLWSENGDGEKILAVRTKDEQEEAQFIADLLRDKGRTEAWKNFAVLFRSNMQARLLEEALREARIPYSVVGAQNFYQTKEIIDSIAFLEAVMNPRDDLSLLRIINVPPRGIGDTTIEKLRKFRDEVHKPIQVMLEEEEYIYSKLPEDAAKSLKHFLEILADYRQKFHSSGITLREVAKKLFEETGYMNGFQAMYKRREAAEKRQDNVFEFLNSMDDFQRRTPDADMRSFLEYVSLFDDSDKEREDDKAEKSAVSLMTVHASKGLEFNTVVISGMERNLFPHQRAMEEGNETEERRLFYVGITRAKKQLFLTYANYRREKNVPVLRRPSMFLDEIPEEYVRFVKPQEVFAKVSDNDLNDMFAQLLGH